MPSMWNWATDRAIIKYTCVFRAGNYGAPPWYAPHHALVPGMTMFCPNNDSSVEKKANLRILRDYAITPTNGADSKRSSRTILYEALPPIFTARATAWRWARTSQLLISRRDIPDDSSPSSG